MKLIILLLLLGMIMPVFAQESPLENISNQLENQITQDNLKKLESRISDIENKINTNQSNTNQNNFQVNANVTIEDLAKFEFNLNSCKQNVTDNCKEVGTKLDKISDELDKINQALKTSDDDSKIQKIYDLNYLLIGIIVALAIANIVSIGTNRDRKKLETKMKEYFEKTTSLIESKSSVNTNIDKTIEDFKEFIDNTNFYKNNVQSIITELSKVLKNTKVILDNSDYPVGITSDDIQMMVKVEEDKINTALKLLEKKKYSEFIDEYKQVESIDEIFKLHIDANILQDLINKHFQVVFTCLKQMPKKSKNENWNTILNLILLKIGIGETANTRK
ncbi:hypothetical protein [Nitrosarchaeum koreense]|uniref:Uncharacterized protein n=1 Tax=Nitrosarchaeum koreense MY1 TaxID=1001994 RepID=F9CVH3_9ARCH|nr:hypothetical protein [Nitrosarchaeum koreense]EGP93275.1 hypothetical protein MY1_0508 [Nitrosarchaeum koreense MY1]